MNFNNTIITENQQIFLPILEEKQVQLFIKREDKIHPFVSGNKFRKLKYNFKEAIRQNKNTLLTFGGAFSNHIVATAVAGKQNGFKTVGVIRGEELGENLEQTLKNNSTLHEAYKNGMTFYFVSRADYRNKLSEEFINLLQNKFGDFYLIPEGGTNQFAVKGCEEILTEQDTKFNYICCAVGTGGTVSGLINSSNKYQKVIGFSALKGNFLENEVRTFVKKNTANWCLNNNYHFGGFAKYNEELISFINKFYKESNILLDPIYTAKMAFGVLDLITKNTFEKQSKIVMIHTGGLQGISGINAQLKLQNKELIKGYEDKV